ncbi:MAG: tetracycline resistance MFS efflux pump, partial [Saprospiraceae bacterium]|nr:tetracycline resistance MFS efflux pump [Saprospiraceae bacterium]
VPQDAQGELQGGLTALMSISAIFGPLLMTQLFQMGSKGLFANSFPGLPFLVAGILVLIAFLLVQKSLKGLEPYKQSPKI